MLFEKLPLQGAYKIHPPVFKDHRGSFSRIFSRDTFSDEGVGFDIVQTNLSFSKEKDTIRGMHYQTGESAEKKLVKCIHGSILDVIIDLREGSSTFGQHYKTELSAKNGFMLLVPEGFAHGFLTLEPDCFVLYQVTNYYNPQKEKAVRWNDPFFGIQWPVNNPVISEKDASHPDFKK